ncbi:ferredoxin-type protein NapF (plasmid) [Rhizobium phaseoli]|uniref:ferredoxin-type protein NapF n=1 Tax=Rhizobium phaseoli TaxID=396 RepID=UPI0007F13AB1|nr:ferredoxin-type protein NapF [Rhizobium phaseoli]ANM07742.1 ferredoxin-type protein NapF [Rhizobium phaseoli]
MSQAPMSRRRFLSGGPATTDRRVCPPGASMQTLAAACTGCGRCEERCPTNIIRLVDGSPSLDFSRGECTFCGECAASCPEPVFSADRVDRFAHVAAVGDACLAKRGITCQSCGEACPQQAIRFRPRIGGPFLPELRADVCNGCGGCIAGCPVSAITLQPRSMEVADA